MRARYLGRDLLPPFSPLPDLARPRLADALRHWSEVGTLPRCAHLTDSTPSDGVYACAAHPRSLFRCRPCTVLHGGRGRHGAYGNCEGCGAPPLDLVDEPPLVIDVAGFGPVAVVGLDLCRGCRDGA